MNPTVVVTGAAGWLGQNLVRALTDRDRVRCLVSSRDDVGLLELVSPNIDCVVGDVREPSTSDRLFDGIGGDATVFHAAAVIHPRKLVRELYDVNVGGTQLVLDRARRAGVRRFVHVSSNSPFGANPTPHDRFDEASTPNPYLGYGRSKLEAEGIVQRAHDRGDVETVIIRPPWFYGPHQPPRQTLFFTMIKAGKFPILGDGNQRRSMAYVDNICQGLALAAAAPQANGETYWIADERPYTLNEIVDTVERMLVEDFGLACSHRRIRLPAAVGEAARMADRCLQGVGLYHQKIHVLGEMHQTIACSIEKAQRELGYRPRIALREGMRRSLEWCIENGLWT